MRTIINTPRFYRLNLLRFYDSLIPVLDNPKRRLIFLYLITKELSDLGFNVGVMYKFHYESIFRYESIDPQEIYEIEFLIKHEVTSLFLGVYANYEIIIRPYSDFIYDFTVY